MYPGYLLNILGTSFTLFSTIIILKCSHAVVPQRFKVLLLLLFYLLFNLVFLFLFDHHIDCIGITMCNVLVSIKPKVSSFIKAK